MLPVHFAPLQGYTEDVYRRAHHRLCGGVDSYYTPFIRVEHGEVRRKERFDMLPEHNEGLPLVLQVIAGDADEMQLLLDAIRTTWRPRLEAADVASEGPAQRLRVDLNLGCPFPLQVRHGKGAGLMDHPDALQRICELMQRSDDLDFSVKMRLGVDAADQWRGLMPLLADTPLHHVVLHPRVATQQYGGEPDMEAFEEFLDVCPHPVVYNGDIESASDIVSVEERYPRLAGVMVGRGLLARPTLAREYKEGATLPDSEVRAVLARLHDAVHESYASRIPGEAQLLSKLRTFWDYAEPTLGRKTWKKVHKAGNLKNYLAAMREV